MISLIQIMLKVSTTYRPWRISFWLEIVDSDRKTSKNQSVLGYPCRRLLAQFANHIILINRWYLWYDNDSWPMQPLVRWLCDILIEVCVDSWHRYFRLRSLKYLCSWCGYGFMIHGFCLDLRDICSCRYMQYIRGLIDLILTLEREESSWRKSCPAHSCVSSSQKTP